MKSTTNWIARLGARARPLAAMALGAATFSAPAGAQEVYIWVRQDTPPVDYVHAVGAPQRPLCRVTDSQTNSASNGSLWIGWFDGTQCVVWYSGPVHSAQTTDLQFLVPTPGHTTRWVEMTTTSPTERVDGDALVGGHSSYMRRDMHICSEGGSTGYMFWAVAGGERGYCSTNSPDHPGGYPPIYKLVGSIVSIYE